MAQDGETLTLKREPVVLRSAEDFEVSIALEPVREATLRSPVDGTVQSLQVALGGKVPAQGELVRLDSQLQRLRLERAEAAVAAGFPTPEIAEIDRKIAAAELSRMTLTAPFAGTVTALDVVDGESVRAGDRLAVVADDSSLQVRLPIERGSRAVGDPITVRVESQEVPGRILAILPAGPTLGRLRPLVESLAEAVVQVENPGSLVAGQTVYADLVPRNPITEVATAAVQTDADGQRVVFVLRRDYAAAVPVQLLGSVGRERVFVVGRFAEGDEVVVESTQPLIDGALVIQQDRTEEATTGGPATDGAAAARQPATPARPRPRAPSTF